MHRQISAALASACAVGLSACSSSGADTGTTGGPVTVAASDTACQLSRTALAAGTTTFAITNKGAKATEVYVYAAGDRIVAEKEDIGPGLGYQLTVQLAAGSYIVACKPGQTGDGIRVPVTVT